MAVFLATTVSTTRIASSFIASSQTSKPHVYISPTKNNLTPRRITRLKPLHVAAPSSSAVAPSPDQKQEEAYGVSDEFSEEGSDAKFSWKDHWYPVSLVEDLDPTLPTPFQLLGRDLVLWFDKSKNQWVAFDDKCPHRLAPLSVCALFLSILKPCKL